MPSYETLPPDNFLGLDAEHSAYERSAAVVLPIPYEGTVSYGQGTREGRARSSRRRSRSSSTTASWPTSRP